MRGKRSEVSPPSSISPGIIWRRRPPGALTSPSFTCVRAAPSLHLQYCFLFTLLGLSSHVTSCSLSQAPRQNSPSVTQHWVDSASKAMLRQHHIMFHKHVFPSRFLSSGRASAVCFQCPAQSMTEGTHEAWWIELDPRMWGLGRAKEANPAFKCTHETQVRVSDLPTSETGMVTWLILEFSLPIKFMRTRLGLAQFSNLVHLAQDWLA